MIQFNLLPAVKLEYVKARRIKRLTMLISTIVAGVSLAILVLLFMYVQIAQKDNSKDLSADIKSESSKLEGQEDLNKILTIQNQLKSLTALHDQKPVTTALLPFIQKITPLNVTLSSINVDFAAATMTMSGSADSIPTINIFVDTLKFTTFSAGDSTGSAFSAIVLTSYNKDADEGANYTISLSFDPIIFNSANKVALVIPEGKITTRSQTEKPLFESNNANTQGNQ